MRDLEDYAWFGACALFALAVCFLLGWMVHSHARRLQCQKDLIPVCQSLPSEQCKALVHNICM